MFLAGEVTHGGITLCLHQVVDGHLAQVGVLFVDDVGLGLVGSEELVEHLVGGDIGGDLHKVADDVVANGFLLKDDFVLAKRKVEAASEQLHVEERPAEEPRANDVGKDDADEHGFG